MIKIDDENNNVVKEVEVEKFNKYLTELKRDMTDEEFKNFIIEYYEECIVI